MISMECEAVDSITRNGGRLHYYLLAGELKISSGYTFVIYKGLERNGYVDFDAFRSICSLTEKGEDAIEKSWLFKIKMRKENIQKARKENKKRILKSVETINY